MFTNLLIDVSSFSCHSRTHPTPVFSHVSMATIVEAGDLGWNVGDQCYSEMG